VDELVAGAADVVGLTIFGSGFVGPPEAGGALRIDVSGWTRGKASSFKTYVVSWLRVAGNCCLTELMTSADVAGSRSKDAHIVDALDSNARGSFTAMGMSCWKSRAKVEGSICFVGGESRGADWQSAPGDAMRSESLCGRSYGFGRLKSR
jgi:hypothetical protein